jgi:hypothetical protein
VASVITARALCCIVLPQNLGKWKQRWFELTPTHLVYFTSTVYRDAAAGVLSDTGGSPRAAIPLAGMEAKAAADAVEGRPYCLKLSAAAASEEDEGEEQGQAAAVGFGTGLLKGVTERVSNVGTGLARVSSFGRAGKTFATYLFDAESAEILASFLYEINLAVLRMRRRPVRKTPLFEPRIYKNDHFAKTGSGPT